MGGAAESLPSSIHWVTENCVSRVLGHLYSKHLHVRWWRKGWQTRVTVSTFRKISLGHISTNEDLCLGNIQENPHVSRGGSNQGKSRWRQFLPQAGLVQRLQQQPSPELAQGPIPEPRASLLLPENSWETRSGLRLPNTSKCKGYEGRNNGAGKDVKTQYTRAWLGNETGTHSRASWWHAQLLRRI